MHGRVGVLSGKQEGRKIHLDGVANYAVFRRVREAGRNAWDAGENLKSKAVSFRIPRSG